MSAVAGIAITSVVQSGTLLGLCKCKKLLHMSLPQLHSANAGHHLRLALQPVRMSPQPTHVGLLSAWLPAGIPAGLSSCLATTADALPDGRARLLAKAELLMPGQPWHIQLTVR